MVVKRLSLCLFCHCSFINPFMHPNFFCHALDCYQKERLGVKCDNFWAALHNLYALTHCLQKACDRTPTRRTVRIPQWGEISFECKSII